MTKAVISIPEDRDKSFYMKLFKKMGIKVRFLSDELTEDVLQTLPSVDGMDGFFGAVFKYK